MINTIDDHKSSKQILGLFWACFEAAVAYLSRESWQTVVSASDRVCLRIISPSR